eukprot:scaffold7399_cov239-Pinguiococcus_pyrenoidosus.AAC.1
MAFELSDSACTVYVPDSHLVIRAGTHHVLRWPPLGTAWRTAALRDELHIPHPLLVALQDDDRRVAPDGPHHDRVLAQRGLFVHRLRMQLPLLQLCPTTGDQPVAVLGDVHAAKDRRARHALAARDRRGLLVAEQAALQVHDHRLAKVRSEHDEALQLPLPAAAHTEARELGIAHLLVMPVRQQRLDPRQLLEARDGVGRQIPADLPHAGLLLACAADDLAGVLGRAGGQVADGALVRARHEADGLSRHGEEPQRAVVEAGAQPRRISGQRQALRRTGSLSPEGHVRLQHVLGAQPPRGRGLYEDLVAAREHAGGLFGVSRHWRLIPALDDDIRGAVAGQGRAE